MKNTFAGIASLAILFALPLTATSKNVTVRVDSQSLTAGTSERGAYYVVSLAIPDEVLGKRLDSVLLEFYVDVAPDATIGVEYAPSIEVFPLTAPLQVGRQPTFSTAHPTSRPVALGEGRHVMIDITDIVKGWIASPSTNHGLVIGSFGGPKNGGLAVRNDLLGNGKAVQATFFYQNRFGQRVSAE